MGRQGGHDLVLGEGVDRGCAHVQLGGHVLLGEGDLVAEVLVHVAANRRADTPADGQGNVGVAHVEALLVGRGDLREVLHFLGARHHLAHGEDEDAEGDQGAVHRRARHDDADDRDQDAQDDRVQGLQAAEEGGDGDHQEDDRSRVDVDHPFRLDLVAGLGGLDQALVAEELADAEHQAGRVDPVVDEVGEQIEELHEHQPEAREDHQERSEPGLEDVAHGNHQDLGGLLEGVLGCARVEGRALGLLEEWQDQEVERDQRRVGEEDVRPVHDPQVAGRPGADEAADVDHGVEDAPAHRGVTVLGGVGDDALDPWFEDGCPRGEQHAAQEEAPVGMLGPHQHVAEDLDGNGQGDRVLVAVAIGESTGEERQQRLDERPPRVDAPFLDMRELEASTRDGVHDVKGENGANAVIGPALDELHDVACPVGPVEGTDLIQESLRLWRRAGDGGFVGDHGLSLSGDLG
ncbi:hypothetical protein D3C87_1108090 [compost metagenome]